MSLNFSFSHEHHRLSPHRYESNQWNKYFQGDAVPKPLLHFLSKQTFNKLSLLRSIKMTNEGQKRAFTHQHPAVSESKSNQISFFCRKPCLFTVRQNFIRIFLVITILIVHKLETHQWTKQKTSFYMFLFHLCHPKLIGWQCYKASREAPIMSQKKNITYLVVSFWFDWMPMLTPTFHHTHSLTWRRNEGNRQESKLRNNKKENREGEVRSLFRFGCSLQLLYSFFQLEKQRGAARRWNIHQTVWAQRLQHPAEIIHATIPQMTSKYAKKLNI